MKKTLNSIGDFFTKRLAFIVILVVALILGSFVAFGNKNEDGTITFDGTAPTYTDAQKVWVMDTDALNESLYAQIDAQSDNAIVTASAALALGLYDEAQIATALNAAIIEEKISLLAESFAKGKLSASEMKEQMEGIVEGSPYTSEIETLIAEAEGNIDKVRGKLDALNGYTITTHVKVQTDEVSAPGGNHGGAAGGSPGGAAANGGSPSPEAGYATGGVVPGPMGMPQVAVVHGGEEVLTPEQRRGRGGNTYINQTFVSNTRESQALAWAQAESVRRARLDRI